MAPVSRRTLLHRAPMALAVLAAPAALVACAPLPPPVRPTQPVSFADRPSIGLNVARIEVVDLTETPGRPPHIEHLAPQRPADAVRGWALDRLQPVARTGYAELSLYDASMVEEELPRTQGWRRHVTVDQASRVTVTLEIGLSAYNLEAGLEGRVTGRASRSLTLAEDLSQAGRNAALQQLLRDTLEDLDGRLDRDIRQRLGGLVRG